MTTPPSGSTSPGATLHTLFERQVRQAPDAVAVVSGSSRTSYAALNAAANRLASRLRLEGTGPARWSAPAWSVARRLSSR